MLTKYQVIVFLTVILSAVASENLVVCYYSSWATYRGGRGQFEVNNIKPDLCTHAVYAFVSINYYGVIQSLDSYLDIPDFGGRNNFGKFNALKQQNPKLKTLLAVGGWNEGSSKYSLMAGNANYRKNFIDSAVDLLLKHGFDGLDLDWEYPNQRDTIYGNSDIQNYNQLLKELRTAFDKHGLLLSAAVAAVKSSALNSYDIPTISKYLNFVNVMTYDLNGPYNYITGHNSPLHKGQGDEYLEEEQAATVEAAAQYWLSQGCPANKLVLGIPLYGHTFILSNANVSSVRAKSSGPGIAGNYTKTAGNIGYNELCELFQSQNWSKRYDNLAKVPYAVLERNWISYDDADSVTAKVQFALSLNISGVMVWSIETDDFRGYCGQPYPLLEAINEVLADNMNSSSSENTTEPTTENSTVDNSEPNCNRGGFLPNPLDCGSYYYCIKDYNGKYIPYLFNCPAGLFWDQNNNYCNYPDLVTCNV